MRVISVSPEALHAGVHPGHALVHARALCPALQLRPLSPSLEHSAREALLDVARSVSPRVAAAPPGTGPWLTEAAVHLDASGMRAIFHSEEGLAAALLARAEAIGLPAVVAVAGSRAAALAAARQLAREPERLGISTDADARVLAREPERLGISTHAGARATIRIGVSHVLQPAEERAVLSELALDLLAAHDGRDDALVAAFARFGLRRLGDLARLPREGLVTRLGAGVRPLLALAHGEPDPVPLPLHEEAHREEAIDLELPLDHLEPLLFVLRGLLGRLLERLALGGLVAGDLTLELGLEGGGRALRHIAVASPTSDVRALLGLVRLVLERHPPPAPVARVSLGGAGARPRHDQLDLFRPAGPAPADLARLLAELEALCGSGRVGAPRVADDRHPDAISAAPFDLRGALHGGDATAATSSHGSPPPASLALRRFRPPAPAEVRVRAGHPVWLRSRPASGHVLESAGPWRTSGRWWTPEARFAFDHFDVRTEREALARVRRNLVSGCWEVDGIYD